MALNSLKLNMEGHKNLKDNLSPYENIKVDSGFVSKKSGDPTSSEISAFQRDSGVISPDFSSLGAMV